MAYDLAISEFGDLVFGANKDLAGTSGVDLIKQRISLRLRLVRGEWVYDEDKTLGSSLHNLFSMSAEQSHTAIEPLVREALRPMDDEITIIGITHEHIDIDGLPTEDHPAATRGIIITVEFAVRLSPDEIFEPSLVTTTDTVSLSI
jgi:hypothetical protein